MGEMFLFSTVRVTHKYCLLPNQHNGDDAPRNQLPDITEESQGTSMFPAVFERAIPAVERPQTHFLDRAASGVRTHVRMFRNKLSETTGLMFPLIDI